MLEKIPQENDQLPTGAIPDVNMATIPVPAKKQNLLRRTMEHKLTPFVLAAAAVVAIETISQEKSDDRLAAMQEDVTRMEEQMGHMAGLLGQSARVDAKTILREGLAQVDTLPGYAKVVSPEHIAAVEDSSVSLLMRSKGEGKPQDWTLYCSGNIVTVGNERVVETAASCFENTLRLQTPTPETADTAYDISPVAAHEYAIMPTVTTAMPHAYPANETVLGSVRNIAVIPSGRTALLGIDTTSQPVLKKDGEALFDVMPALTPKDVMPRPPGQRVALAPRLESMDNARQTVSGVLLGMLKTRNDQRTNDSFFAVGMRSNPPQTDGCGLGALGVLADGTLTGPAYESINPSANPDHVTAMLQIEDALGLSAETFTAACKFDNPGVQELDRLAAAFGRVPGPELIAR